MSAVVVVTPLVIAGWPVITAAVTAAVSSIGFTVLQAAEAHRKQSEHVDNRTELEVEESEVLSEGGLQEELVVVRGDIRAVFTRDENGALKLCVEGENHSKEELREIGQLLIGRVTQQFVYHKLMTELQDRNMNVVEEEVTEDRAIRIRVRSL